MRQLTVTYGSPATELALSAPLPRWTLRTRRIGGSAIADSGVPASYVRRTDHIIEMTAVVLESELASVETWLAYVRNDTAFGISVTEGSGTRSVFLESPVVGESDVVFQPHEFVGAYTVDLAFRSADGQRFSYSFMDVVAA